MKSHDLATLAQVSVRALRHYHQVGVLPEPPRTRNGYRDYTVHDLVRLLRIKRLAALGIPLDQMPAMFEADPADQASMLSQLETDVDAQIGRLQAQKTLIRLIRDNGGAADFPPRLARAMAMFAGLGVSPAMTRMDRDQVLLLAHLVGEPGMDRLVEVYDRVSETHLQDDTARLATRFDLLPADATEPVIEGLVTDFDGFFAPLTTELSAAPGFAFLDEAAATALLDAYQADTLNPAQRAVLARLTEKLG
ncbi:MerR family transcriptional regulator [Cryobacterium sp. SO1]|uniref:MerR family transcriptional regulator n=1 Tax=Cryobacterium sp. SO1 TaxID=1897061 RepID=UPI001023DE07|nr:MerR family transcriptional regulator [Cryobacterium sp. SO1]RZI33883.1 HTH-type transcriptional activator TipA [Cryobacterium sp. SO1]